MNNDVLKPRSLKESLQLKSKFPEAKIIAGGTDLIVKAKDDGLRGLYINILGNEDLSKIDFDSQKMVLSSAVTHQTIVEHKEIASRFPALNEACGLVGSWQIRNIATVGGNLCNGAPSAETAPPLYIYNAKVILANAVSERVVPIAEFFLGPGQTVLKKDEILTAIMVPHVPQYSGSVYLKHGLRKAVNIAIVGVAALITLDAQEKCREARIALGAVAPTPLRLERAEKKLIGKKISENSILEAAKIAVEEAKPIDDIRASAQYREKIIYVLTKRAIARALTLAGKQVGSGGDN